MRRNAVAPTVKVNKTFVTYDDLGNNLHGGAVPSMVEGLS
jgi:hypothetical protein